MPQRVSMADIARRLDISRATVSYVLNERESELISEATRERVLAAAREMGYRPNRAAQALAGRRSYLIELFVYGYYPAFYARMLHEFNEQVGPTPYQLHIIDPYHWTGTDWGRAEGSWPIDGIILVDVAPPTEIVESFKERGVPLVWVGIMPATDVDHVRVDLTPALLEAVRHLAARSKRVAFLSPWSAEETLDKGDPRYPAYRAAMREANLPEEIIMTPNAPGVAGRASAREIIREYVAKNGCPEAMLCFNDERAIATCAALRDLGLRVPDDVKIIGCDGIEETTYYNPSISTIEYPLEETARLAWQALQRRIEEPDAPLQGTTLTAKLVLRESSAP
jgi:DNA-binding LacI/PurR family transcriptional regulator